MNKDQESQTQLQELKSYRLESQAPKQSHIYEQRPAHELLKDFCNEPSIQIWPSNKKQQQIHSSKINNNYKCGCSFSTPVYSSMKDHIISKHKGRCILGSTHYLSPITKKLIPCKKTIQKSSNIESKTTELQWKGFVLIKNDQFSCRKGNFYCGQCDVYFLEAPDFIQHCLSACGELYNCKSSHKIYTKEDWIKQSYCNQIPDTKIVPLEKSIKPILDNETEIIEISSMQIGSQQIYEDSDRGQADFHQCLYKFTQEIIKLKSCRIFSERRANNPYRNYFYDYQNDNYMVLLNPSKQITSESFKNIKCYACGKIIIILYYFKAHVIEEKCHQSLQSTFYLLYKRLFLGRYRKRIFRYAFSSISIVNFTSKVDPELLYEKINFDQQISGPMRQFFLKNKGFIKLYCGEIWSQLGKPFECKSCKMASYSPLKLFRHYETKCRSVNSFILIMFKKKGHLNKYKLLSLTNNFLAKQPFYCPCNPSQVLTKYQFVSHIIDFHERYIELELFLDR